MKKKVAILTILPLLILSIVIIKAKAGSAPLYEQYKVMTSTAPIYILQNDGTETISGPLQFGNDVSTPTTPTSVTMNNYSIKEPYYNATSSAIPRGSIILSSSSIAFSSSSIAFGTFAAVTATTTVIGVNDQPCAINTNCYMIISGYGLVLTTGPVVPGDVIVSSAGALGTGYQGWGGVSTGTQVVGTAVGKAVGIGQNAGGLTPCLISLE